MADAVKALTHWRRGRDVRLEHTREVVHDVPQGAVDAMVRLADELDSAKARLARLERAIASLAQEATKS
jgi:acyl-CoA synthetase (NDP forming)